MPDESGQVGIGQKRGMGAKVLAEGVQGNGAGHEYIVVITGTGTVRTVRAALIHQQLVACGSIAFHICAVAHSPYQSRYNHLFGCTVGVESRTRRAAFGSLAEIQVGIMFIKLREFDENNQKRVS